MNKNIGIAVMTAALFVLGACKSTTYNTTVKKENPSEAAKYNALLGVEYLRRGEVGKAKEKIEKALKSDNRVPVAHTAAAMLYDRMGEFDKADSHYKTAIRLKPDDPEMVNQYGSFLCSRARYSEGEQMMVKAAKDPLYNTPFVAYGNAGLCMLSANRPADAEKYFQQALMLRPKFTPALTELAKLTFRDKRYAETKTYIDRFMMANRQSSQSDPEMPNMLWIGVQVEDALNNPTTAHRYAQRLKQEYPKTEQTRALLKSERPAG